MKDIYYPIALKLKERKAVVVGGGVVAERKVKALLSFGSRVTVISPDLTAPLERLFRLGKISRQKRGVKASDIKDAYIVIAATSCTRVNKKVSAWAKRSKIPVNVVDNKDLSDFISPAVFKKGKATVAVSTDGNEPKLSRDLKDFIEERWDEFLSYRRRL